MTSRSRFVKGKIASLLSVEGYIVSSATDLILVDHVTAPAQSHDQTSNTIFIKPCCATLWLNTHHSRVHPWADLGLILGFCLHPTITILQLRHTFSSRILAHSLDHSTLSALIHDVIHNSHNVYSHKNTSRILHHHLTSFGAHGIHNVGCISTYRMQVITIKVTSHFHHPSNVAIDQPIRGCMNWKLPKKPCPDGQLPPGALHAIGTSCGYCSMPRQMEICIPHLTS